VDTVFRWIVGDFKVLLGKLKGKGKRRSVFLATPAHDNIIAMISPYLLPLLFLFFLLNHLLPSSLITLPWPLTQTMATL